MSIEIIKNRTPLTGGAFIEGSAKARARLQQKQQLEADRAKMKAENERFEKSSKISTKTQSSSISRTWFR